MELSNIKERIILLLIYLMLDLKKQPPPTKVNLL